MKKISLLLFAVLAAGAGCDWFEGQVQANLQPETELVDCASGQDVVEGDDVRFVWRGIDVDGDITGCEWTLNDGPWETTDRDTIEIHGIEQGEYVFKVSAIDDDGEADPTPAECTFTAGVAGKLVDRVVLLELFTTVTCQYCPNAEDAFNAILGDMGRDKISVIAYHDRPDIDRFSSPEMDARIAWYTDNPAFPVPADRWPTVVFDGLRTVVGAEDPEATEASYRIEIASRAETGSPLSITLAGDISTGQGDVTVRVRAEDQVPEGSWVLRIVVIEDDLPYRFGFSDEYDFVARLLLDDETLTAEAPGDSMLVERDFTVDETWVPENMDVIAFVQNTVTMEVIQSGRLKLE
ncbi:MAG: hypothetical protein PVH52_00500 [bacterium]|jgi:hypothetical protein